MLRVDRVFGTSVPASTKVNYLFKTRTKDTTERSTDITLPVPMCSI